MPNYELFVAQYGHVRLDIKHWALVVREKGSKIGTAYQITGGKPFYAMKEPETVEMEKASTYLGKAAVGEVDSTFIRQIPQLLQRVPVVRNVESFWNCQDWVVGALAQLQSVNSSVLALSKEELQNKFE